MKNCRIFANLGIIFLLVFTIILFPFCFRSLVYLASAQDGNNTGSSFTTVAYNSTPFPGYIGSITCIPVKQFSRQRTQIECRLDSSKNEAFVVSEINFPFNITNLIKVSSSYSATVGTLYSPELADNTIVVTALRLGGQNSSADFQPASFDTLSFLVETDQSMSAVREALIGFESEVYFLAQEGNSYPVYKVGTLSYGFILDNTLLLEAFAQHDNIGSFNFLKLGLACYEKTPEECLSNLAENY